MKYFFPDATLVPILASVNARPEEWRAAAEAIAPLVDDRTLVVQSTDYSHYRPLPEAIVRDQETLGIIAAGDPDAVPPLLQPSHMDSKAAQFVQMALQNALGARPVVLANRNSAEYSGARDVTTSYVVTAYLRDPDAGAAFRYDDQEVTYFAGDALLGRFLTPALSDPGATAAIADAVTRVTQGAPLVVNLEGAIVDEPVVGAPATAHVMSADIALPVLAELGAAAASLANNHSYDLGALGLAESQRILAGAGVVPVVHGQAADLGAFRMIALNFVQSLAYLGSDHYTDDAAIACDIAAEPPIVAFVHWGREYTNEPEAKARHRRGAPRLRRRAGRRRAQPPGFGGHGGVARRRHPVGLFGRQLPVRPEHAGNLRRARRGALLPAGYDCGTPDPDAEPLQPRHRQPQRRLPRRREVEEVDRARGDPAAVCELQHEAEIVAGTLRRLDEDAPAGGLARRHGVVEGHVDAVVAPIEVEHEGVGLQVLRIAALAAFRLVADRGEAEPRGKRRLARVNAAVDVRQS